MFAHRLPVFIFWSLKVSLWITVPINVTHARKPVLNFDFARLTECYESSSLEITNVYDDEKLVELKLRVSVHLLAGDISDVEDESKIYKLDEHASLPTTYGKLFFFI